MTPHATDTVGLTWLVTVRWTTLIAGVGAIAAGQSALQLMPPVGVAAALLVACAISNLWLITRLRRAEPAALVALSGRLVCADVLLISWLISQSGGVMNPASVFYLIQIVVTALVLGPRWTGIVTGLSVAAYAALFLATPDELKSAQAMHPEVALHMRGMWVAFAASAILIAILVARLARAVERRDRQLSELRAEAARAGRVAGLATLAAGAAHELSTPLGTIAVAAGELERSLSAHDAKAEWRDDARLIRDETQRCRRILDALAGSSGAGLGEQPRSIAIGLVMDELLSGLHDDERKRIAVDGATDRHVTWPTQVVTRALVNIVRNAIQASPLSARVHIHVAADPGHVRLVVRDSGVGMTPTDMARAGEPFFTTKPHGTGLGLFVARTSIEQLGGSVVIDSEVGRGTTVTITLPVDVVHTPENVRG